MHCYAFEMYLKDGPLRRSSECIAMHSKCIDLRNAVPKRRSLKEFWLFFCSMYALIFFAGNIKCQGGEGPGGEWGVGEEEEEEEEGGNFKFQVVFFCKYFI